MKVFLCVSVCEWSECTYLGHFSIIIVTVCVLVFSLYLLKPMFFVHLLLLLFFSFNKI